MSDLLKPCVVCGQPSDQARCNEHRPVAGTRPSRAAGYDARWDRLSRQARKIQPFCTDCGTTNDLTADHLPQAWERKAAGKTIRLCDVEVVCRSCNSKRGAARGEKASRHAEKPLGQSKFGSHTPGGYQ